MTEKTLLLHACCGPCAIMPTLRLQEEGYQITLWYMNPNIHPLSEYLRRREAICECASRLGVSLICKDECYDPVSWLSVQLPDAGSRKRCIWCCQSRLEAVFNKASESGYSAFSTSLLYSRYQPHEEIAQKGKSLDAISSVRFLYRDFRKDWQKGIEISKSWGIYRQPYCGCIFSESERYAKKFAQIRKISPEK